MATFKFVTADDPSRAHRAGYVLPPYSPDKGICIAVHLTCVACPPPARSGRHLRGGRVSAVCTRRLPARRLRGHGDGRGGGRADDVAADQLCRPGERPPAPRALVPRPACGITGVRTARVTRAVVLQAASPEPAGRRASPVITLVQHAVSGQVSSRPSSGPALSRSGWLSLGAICLPVLALLFLWLALSLALL